MASSSVTYTSGTNNFNITFPYLRDKHVVVMVGGTLYDIDDSYFTIDASSSTKKVVLTNPVSEGTTIKILRMSLGKNNDLYNDDNLGTLVDFVDGSVLTEKQQDESYLHNYYLNQESLEGNLKLGTPILDSDPATKGYVDGIGISGGGGSVTSVTAGNGLSGGTITTSGTVSIPTSGGTLNINSGKVGIGGDADSTYHTKLTGDVLIKEDSDTNTVLTLENAHASGGLSTLLLYAHAPVIQFNDKNAAANKKIFNLVGNEGVLQLTALNDAGSTVATPFSFYHDGNVKLDSLPTSDPSTTGYLWNDGGVVSVSGSSGFSGGGSGIYQSSLSTDSGYTYFTNGMVIQWGKLSNVALNQSFHSVTWPVAFGVACDNVSATIHRASGTISGAVAPVVKSITTTGCEIAGDHDTNTSTGDIYWQAIGRSAQQSSGGSGSSGTAAYSSGWFNNTSGLANGGTYSFTHGLGTEDLITAIWVADDSSGTNKQLIFSDTGDSSAGSKVDGAVVSDASSTTLEVQLGANGGFSVSSTGNWSSFNWSTKYFKVVALASGSSSGVSSYSSGWATSHGSTTVADGATLTFTHGLGTADLTIQAYVSPYSDGSYAQSLDTTDSFQDGAMWGGVVTAVTSTTITYQLGSAGYLYMKSTGESATSTTNGHNAGSSGSVPFTSKYIKLVAIG